MKKITSKERLLAAVRRQTTDYVPCSPSFNPLSPQQRVGYRYQFPWGPSERERVEYCVCELGIDPVVSMNCTDYYQEDSVGSRVWLEAGTIHKAYTTPSGELHAAVRYDEGWPHGFDVPFYSDFNIGHFVEPWLETEADVECLRHILLPARTKDQLARLRFFFGESKRLADTHGLPLLANIGAGLTGAMQLFGAEKICLLAADDPDLVHRYLEMEHQFNLRAIEIALDLGVDIVRRNGFYETCDFYSPAMLETFLARRLQEEIDTVHQAGRVITYTVHTGIIPMLDYLDGLGFDCIMHIDTAFKGVDLSLIKAQLASKKSFWFGPSNTFHMWAEDPEVVRRSVREVFASMGKTGLILAPCPSAHSIMPWENTLAMIDEWKMLRSF